MKRPDGFDRRVEQEPVPARARSPLRARGRSSSAQSSAPPSAQATGKSSVQESARPPKAETASVPRQARTPAGTSPARLDRLAQRALRRAEAKRRRFEKGEVRRFTRRSRRRRITWAVVAGVVVAMLGLVAVAVYSPLLALTSIEIDGTSRVDPAQVLDAVDGQLDTPLALIDFSTIEDQLGSFPLIKSYVTETKPPDTLVIHIVERQPVGAVADGAGFSLVDPAGIVIERAQTRIAGVPLIDIGSADVDSPAFDAAVEVLLALPDSVLAQLDTITARTKDDVRLALAGGGASIIWGSADQSDYKARVLAAALANNFPGVSEYNVSAPGQLTYR